MEIRTDFTALVLPSDAELQLAAERARLASEAAGITRRRFRFPALGRRQPKPATTRAVAH